MKQADENGEADPYRYHRKLTYKCNECGTVFAYWIASDEDWIESGFEWRARTC